MKLPASINLIAANWAQHEAKRLVRFGAERTGEAPSWEGREEAVTGSGAGVPITDREYWAGRYVLCELTLESESGERVTLADAVASVSRERIIVCTPLTGRDGTVKEYIREGDWAVTLVIGLQHVDGGELADEWPEAETRQLRRILEEKGAVRVYSSFLDVFGISRVVVRGFRASQMTESNYQVVTIDALSDEEYELISTEY